MGHKGRDEGQWAEDPEASAVPRLRPVGLVDRRLALRLEHPQVRATGARTGYSSSPLTTRGRSCAWAWEKRLNSPGRIT